MKNLFSEDRNAKAMFNTFIWEFILRKIKRKEDNTKSLARTSKVQCVILYLIVRIIVDE